MEQSSVSLSNELSKSVREDFSISKDVPGLVRPKEPESISNEQIQKGDLILDMYEVTSDAVHGGMGSVWRVRQKGARMDYAMKRPQPRFFAEGSLRRKEEFIKECENWIRLGLHPNIVACFYVRGIGGVPTIFSEWMDRGSLKDCIQSGELYEGPEAEVQERILDIAIQAARGLQFSHEKGLVHQDVKPGNLLLGKGYTLWDTKVADFGLAKAQSQLTDGGKPLSSGYTRAYCPREQAEGAPAETWMDVYAWALTVLEMYCGKRLWETGADAAKQLRSIVKQSRIPIPRAIRKLIKACLKKRYASFEPLEPLLVENYRAVRGREYENTRKREEAASNTADSLNNQAISYMELGMLESAERCWAEAREINFSHTEAMYNAGLLAWRTGRQTSAALTRQLRGHPFYFNTEEGKEALAALAREAGKTAVDEPLFSDEPIHEVDVSSSDGRFQQSYLRGNRVYLITKNPAGNKDDKAASWEKLLVLDAESGELIGEDDFAEACRVSGEIISSASLRDDAAVAVLGTSDDYAILYDVEKRCVLQTVKLVETGMYDFGTAYGLTGTQNRFLYRAVSHGMGHAPSTTELYDLKTGERLEPRFFYDPKAKTQRAVMDGKRYMAWQLVDCKENETPGEPASKEYTSLSDGLTAIRVYRDGDRLYWCDTNGKVTEEIQPVLASELLSRNGGTLRLTGGKTIWRRGSEGLMNFDLNSGKCLRSYTIDRWNEDYSIDEDGLGILCVRWGNGLKDDKPSWQYRKLPEIREEDKAAWVFSEPETFLRYRNRVGSVKAALTEFMTWDAKAEQGSGYNPSRPVFGRKRYPSHAHKMCEIYESESQNPRFHGSEEQKVMEARLNAECREKDGFAIEVLDIEIRSSGEEREALLQPYGLEKGPVEKRAFEGEIFRNKNEEQIFRNQQGKNERILDVNEKHGLILYATELGALEYAFRLWSMDERRNLMELPLDLHEYRGITACFSLTEESGVRFLVAPKGLTPSRRDGTVPVKEYQYGWSYQPAAPRRRTDILQAFS